MFKSDGNVIHFAAPKGNGTLFPPLVQPTEGRRSHLCPQFTPPFHPTHSPSTELVKTKNSPNSYPASSINSAPTPSHPSASWPRATNPYRSKKAKARTTMKRRISRIWLQARRLRTRSNKRFLTYMANGRAGWERHIAWTHWWNYAGS